MARRKRRKRRTRASRTDVHSLVGAAVLLLLVADLGRELAPAPVESVRVGSSDEVLVTSFNVKWVGYYTERDDEALARMLADYDIVVVQEIVSPPYPGTFPDGRPFRPDPESREFFDAMAGQGFAFLLSPEDTGRRATNQDNSSATEWFAAFYRPEVVVPAPDLPGGFLAEDVTDNPEFDRVPYAFGFRTVDERADFVLISVHLTQGERAVEARRRELAAIARWIDDRDQHERDFIVLGDMNIHDCSERDRILPAGFRALDDRCQATNTVQAGDPRKGRPYDQVLVRPEGTEVDLQSGMQVRDLVEAMRPHWRSREPYVGDPYDHDRFVGRYSDHHPIELRIVKGARDDD